MDCLQTRPRLRALVSGELSREGWEDLSRHVAFCGACRRLWAAVDPLGATRAFGGHPRAPLGLREAVMAGIRKLPAPTRRPALSGAPIWLAAAGVVGLWFVLHIARPLAVAILAMGLQAVAAATAVAGATLEVTLQVMHPAVWVLAGLLVAGELVIFTRGVRPVG